MSGLFFYLKGFLFNSRTATKSNLEYSSIEVKTNIKDNLASHERAIIFEATLDPQKSEHEKVSKRFLNFSKEN